MQKYLLVCIAAALIGSSCAYFAKGPCLESPTIADFAPEKVEYFQNLKKEIFSTLFK